MCYKCNRCNRHRLGYNTYNTYYTYINTKIGHPAGRPIFITIYTKPILTYGSCIIRLFWGWSQSKKPQHTEAYVSISRASQTTKEAY